MNKKSKKSKIRRLLSLFQTVIRVQPGLFLFEYAMMFVDAIATAALLPLLSAFFAVLAAGPATGWSNQREIFQALALLFLVYVIAEVASGCSHYCGEVYSNLSVRGLRRAFHDRMQALPVLEYEKPEVMEVVEAAYDGTYDVRSLLNTLLDFVVFYLPYFVSYAYYLYRMDAKLLLLLPCLFLPLLLAQCFKAKASVRYEETFGTYRRMEASYQTYQQTPETVRELRCLGTRQYFANRYHQLQQKILVLLNQKDLRSCLYQWAGEFLQFVFYIGFFIVLLWAYVRGEVQIPELGAVLMTVMTVRNLADEFINYRVGEVAENYGIIQRCLEVEAYWTLDSKRERIEKQETKEAPQCRGEEAHPKQPALEFEDVTFAYPGSSANALEHISFALHEGETLALVGANGSGKSTLSKLFLGLYPPVSGRIRRYGRLQTSEEEIGAARDNSAVFQNFNRYRRTVRENLEFTGAASDDALLALLESLELSAEKNWPEGLDTYLDPAFGGVDLSGGQWQKLALARAKLKHARFVSLDEPTAALDPIFESQVYRFLLDMARDRVSLIVTHRLALAKQCDRILLLQDGKLLDLGTHEQLLSRSDLYRSMWQNQAETY